MGGRKDSHPESLTLELVMALKAALRISWKEE